MNTAKIAIICDSGTDVPTWFAKEHDVRIVPLGITYSDGITLRAGVDITESEVVARFAQEIPTTSLPSPQDIRDAFDQARADGYERAVMVTISSGLSSTNQTSHLIASQLEDFPVIVIDTLSIGVAAGLVVMAAAEMVESGVPFEALEDKLNLLSKFTKVFFCVKDLKYLRKGGRIDALTYRIGSVLNIKPIIWCDEVGFYRTYRKGRGWDKALRQEFKCVQEFAEKNVRSRLAVACTDASKCFEMVEGWMRESVPNIVEIVRAGISPALLVHTGPELVGMAVQPDWHTL